MTDDRASTSPAPVASDLGVDLPDDHADAVTVLLDALQTAQSSADGYLDDLRRVAADYENYRKRVQREQEHVTARAAERVVEAMLPVLDSFEQAFSYEASSESEAGLVNGMRSTYHQLMDVLAKEGLERIPAQGEAFDPEVHEAVSGITDGEGRLIVSSELRAGYRLGGRVLRPAMVAVDVEGD